MSVGQLNYLKLCFTATSGIIGAAAFARLSAEIINLYRRHFAHTIMQLQYNTAGSSEVQNGDE